jgi:TetR/AcrR family transcriptional regulator
VPQQTFFNLPDEKRQQILQVAMDEFAENDYDKVSISRMVARAGIAKGSFYQYFADKEDLYGYLLGLLAEAKTEFMSLDHPDPNHVGIFAYLRWLTEVGVAFQLAHPQLSKIAVRAANANFFPKAFDMSAREQTQAFYRRLVEVGQAQGDIAPGVDPQVAAVMFDGMMTSVSRFLLDKIARGEIVLNFDEATLFDLPDVKTIFTTAVDLLEYGMRGYGRDHVHALVQPAAYAAGSEGD